MASESSSRRSSYSTASESWYRPEHPGISVRRRRGTPGATAENTSSCVDRSHHESSPAFPSSADRSKAEPSSSEQPTHIAGSHLPPMDSLPTDAPAFLPPTATSID